MGLADICTPIMAVCSWMAFSTIADVPAQSIWKSPFSSSGTLGSSSNISYKPSTKGSVMKSSICSPIERNSVWPLLFCISASPKVCGARSPCWPWLISGMLLSSSACLSAN